MLQSKDIEQLNGKISLPTHILPTREPPQKKTPTQTESEGLETNIPSKWTGIKSWGSNTYINQNRLQNKGHKDTQKDTTKYSKEEPIKKT